MPKWQRRIFAGGLVQNIYEILNIHCFAYVTFWADLKDGRFWDQSSRCTDNSNSKIFVIVNSKMALGIAESMFLRMDVNISFEQFRVGDASHAL